MTFIACDRVWMTGGNDQLCQSQMFKPPASPSATAAPPPPASATPASQGAPGGVSDDIKNGIRRKSATEFDIDRGVVDKILENQADLMRQARISPETENGDRKSTRLN